MITVLEWLLAGVGIWLLAALGVIVIRRWAERRNLFDVPNQRSSHTKPTPRSGGLAITAITLVGVLAYKLFSPQIAWSSVLFYLVGGGLIAVVSWFDDLHAVKAWIRLCIHGLGAILAIVTLGSWQVIAIPFFGPISLGWISGIVTFIWIVGVTNAFNFIDGIDGIAGGQITIAGMGWFIIGGLSGQPIVVVIGLLLAMTSLGFLGQNWPPAQIFMGDVGSAFVGYTLAILPLMGAQNDPRLPFTAIILYWPVLFDTGFTFLRRMMTGENVLAAHRTHLYQRLVIAGYQHVHVTVLYMAQAVSGLLLAFGWVIRLYWSGTVTALLIPSMCIILWVFVIRRERVFVRQTMARNPPLLTVPVMDKPHD